MELENFLGLAIGLIFGEDLDELFVPYLERHFPNSPFLLRVDCEPCRSSDIVLSESFIKKKKNILTNLLSRAPTNSHLPTTAISLGQPLFSFLAGRPLDIHSYFNPSTTAASYTAKITSP